MVKSKKYSKKGNKSRKMVRKNRRRGGAALDQTPGDKMNATLSSRYLDPSPQIPSA